MWSLHLNDWGVCEKVYVLYHFLSCIHHVFSLPHNKTKNLWKRFILIYQDFLKDCQTVCPLILQVSSVLLSLIMLFGVMVRSTPNVDKRKRDGRGDKGENNYQV